METLEAQAPTTTATTPTAQPEAQNSAVTQREELERQLSDPNWTPATSTTKSEPAKAEPVRETPQAEVTEPEAEPVVEKPEPVAAAEEDEDEVVAQPEDPKGKRIRIADPKDQQFQLLRKGGFSAEEAFTRVYGPAKTEPEPQAQSDPMAQYRARLDEINTVLDKVDDDDVMTGAQQKLVREQARLSAEIAKHDMLERVRTESEEQKQQASAVRLQTEQSKALAKAKQDYPQVAVIGSALNLEAKKLQSAYAGSAFLDEPTAPVEIVEMAATRLATRQAKANGTTFETEFATITGQKPTVVAPKVESKKPTVIASGAKATIGSDKPQTDKEQLAAVASDAKSEAERLNQLLYFKT